MKKRRKGPKAGVAEKPIRAPQTAESLNDTWRRVTDERLRLARKLCREHRERRRLGPSGNVRTREPVFSCRECVFRMDSVHWRNVSDDDAAVLRALKGGGPGTLGDILRRARRKTDLHSPRIVRLMQALTTLVASGLVEEFRVRGEARRGRPRHPRVRLPSWAKLLLPGGSRIGLGPASEAGRALARLHSKSRRPPSCEG